MKRLISAVTAIVAIVSGTAFSRVRPTSVRDFLEPGRRTRMIARWGFWSRAPENTLAAIREAIAVGADIVEIDVTLSSHGEIVVIHDETLQLTTAAPGRSLRSA